jgi:hypothetical protein
MRAPTIVLAMAVGLAVACWDQGPVDVTGAYALWTVNGSGPPFDAYTT